jgi:hypothetical protein
MHSIGKQTAVRQARCVLTGRRWAPTRGPTQWGGEGTLSRQVRVTPARPQSAATAIPSNLSGALPCPSSIY